MPNNKMDNYGSPSSEFSGIPKRSRLYFLEPIALDTPYFEGLVSYICRLAEAHAVSPGILIKQEILPCFRKTYSVSGRTAYKVQDDGLSTAVFSVSAPPYRKHPNEYGLLAWQYIEGLEALTLKNNLQALTIPPWLGVQDFQEVNLAREQRVWCPDCIEDWLACDQLVYEPLIWSIAAVTVCPHHHRPLLNRCPHCHRSQRPMSGRMQVGRCAYCLNWLNIQSEEPFEAELLVEAELDWHDWVAEQVTKVLATPSRTPTQEIRNEITRVIHKQEQLQLKDFNASNEKMQWHLLEILAR